MNYFYYYEGKNEKASMLRGVTSTVRQYMDERFENKGNSPIKSSIDNWYKTNIVSKGYEKYVDNNSVWCNDRTMTSGSLYSSSAGFGGTLFAATGSRRLNTSSPSPAVKEASACSNSRDRYTASSANTGNRSLTYPVGTLTADEVILGGITFTDSGSDSYLTTDFWYWTMTPYKWGEEYNVAGQNYVVNSSGQMTKNSVTSSNNIRPSISLKPGTKVFGIGTKDDPYEVAPDKVLIH